MAKSEPLTDHDHKHILADPFTDEQYVFIIKFLKFINAKYSSPTPRREVMAAFKKENKIRKMPDFKRWYTDHCMQNMVKVTVRNRDTHPMALFVLSIPMDGWLRYNMSVSAKHGTFKTDSRQRIIQFESIEGDCFISGSHDHIDQLVKRPTPRSKKRIQEPKTIPLSEYPNSLYSQFGYPNAILNY